MEAAMTRSKFTQNWAEAPPERAEPVTAEPVTAAPPVICELCGRRFAYATYLAMPDEGEPDLCTRENPFNKDDPRPCCMKRCVHGSPPCRPCVVQARTARREPIDSEDQAP